MLSYIETVVPNAEINEHNIWGSWKYTCCVEYNNNTFTIELNSDEMHKLMQQKVRELYPNAKLTKGGVFFNSFADDDDEVYDDDEEDEDDDPIPFDPVWSVKITELYYSSESLEFSPASVSDYSI